jgi:hypothetical protein
MTNTSTEQTINWLRGKAKGAPDHAWQHMMNAAADKLSELQEELLCGLCRLQDFEVAEAQQLAEIKADRDAMAAELKRELGCGGCKHCREDWDAEPCNTCRQDKDFPAWEWKGATQHG